MKISNDVGQQDSAAHLVPASVIAIWLSGLESTSIDNGAGGPDNCDDFLLKAGVNSFMRCLSDGLSLDIMMIVQRRALAWLYDFAFSRDKGRGHNTAITKRPNTTDIDMTLT